jgi:hypothetical protein
MWILGLREIGNQTKLVDGSDGVHLIMFLGFFITAVLDVYVLASAPALESSNYAIPSFGCLRTTFVRPRDEGIREYGYTFHLSSSGR